jgi:hypothetical protein
VAISLLCLLLIPVTAFSEQETSLSVEPSSGKPEAGLIISGSGFAPGQQIDLRMTIGHTPHGIGTGEKDIIKADQEGKFVVHTAIPSVADPGSYTIKAKDQKGNVAKQEVQVLE